MPATRKYDSLYVNATILTSSDPYAVMQNAAVACAEGKIAWLGPAADLSGATSNQVVDCQGRWIVPGFIDCHTHVVFAGDRSDEYRRRQSGASYEDIAREGGGILSTVRATRDAEEDNLFAQAAKRVWRLIEDGVTTIEIKSGYGLDTESEAKMLRVARRIQRELPVTVKTTFLGLHALPPEFANRREDYLDEVCDQTLPMLVSMGLVDAVDAFCEPIAFSVGEIERFFICAQDLGIPVKLHAEQLSNSHGAELACGFGALSVDHLEYLDDSGVAAMKECGATAVLLPGAYYFLRESQRPPVSKLREAGVPMAVATDCNPGSSPLLSIRAAANMAVQLFGLTVEEALDGITQHAARALGIYGSAGSIEVGKDANFLVCDIGEPTELVYWLGRTGIDEVIHMGKSVRFPEVNAADA